MSGELPPSTNTVPPRHSAPYTQAMIFPLVTNSVARHRDAVVRVLKMLTQFTEPDSCDVSEPTFQAVWLAVNHVLSDETDRAAAALQVATNNLKHAERRRRDRASALLGAVKALAQRDALTGVWVTAVEDPATPPDTPNALTMTPAVFSDLMSLLSALEAL